MKAKNKKRLYWIALMIGLFAAGLLVFGIFKLLFRS